jgi:hypothetical protein
LFCKMCVLSIQHESLLVYSSAHGLPAVPGSGTVVLPVVCTKKGSNEINTQLRYVCMCVLDADGINPFP